MPTEFAAYAAIALIAVVTFATRAAGPVFMSLITASPRIERFLEAMAVSVIAALVASLAVNAGGRELAALGVAAAVTLWTRNLVGAMLAGTALGAAWFFI